MKKVQTADASLASVRYLMGLAFILRTASAGMLFMPCFLLQARRL